MFPVILRTLETVLIIIIIIITTGGVGLSA
jgi:hypothetical protein